LEKLPVIQTTDIEQEISTFLTNNFLYGRTEALRPEDSLLGNVIDSAGVMEFVMFLQEKFSITVEDEEVNTDNLDSVKKAVVFVDRKLREQR
jgi:acyl carrier protein